MKDYDTKAGVEFSAEDKPLVKEALEIGVEALAALQDILYAQDRWSLLVIFQAMDAAGKDGAIKHVMSGVNPQGCQVSSFKSPSNEELDHDFRGVARNIYPKEAELAFSTALIMKKYWSCACMKQY